MEKKIFVNGQCLPAGQSTAVTLNTQLRRLLSLIICRMASRTHKLHRFCAQASLAIDVCGSRAWMIGAEPGWACTASAPPATFAFKSLERAELKFMSALAIEKDIKRLLPS